MAKFVISKRSNGEFQFNLKSDNGETILTSEGYASRDGCIGGIQSVKNHSPQDANYDKKVSTNNKHYFNLKANNGQIIATSEQYETTAGRDGGIASVKQNAPDARIEE